MPKVAHASMRMALILPLLISCFATPFVSFAQPNPREDAIPPGALLAELTRIIDGDTFDATLSPENRRSFDDRIRMIGIDTPETSYSYGNEPECYGKEATRKTESVLVAAEEIWLESDVGDKEPNGRLLRYVWYISHVDGTVHFLNEELVQPGYALAKTYRPNTKYQDRLDLAEDRAITASAGMWLTCDASVSGDPRPENPASGPDDVPINRTTTRLPTRKRPPARSSIPMTRPRNGSISSRNWPGRSTSTGTASPVRTISASVGELLTRSPCARIESAITDHHL